MMNENVDDSDPGRTCPRDYYYGAASLARTAEFEATTLYVVGGLYGNRLALDAIEKMAGAEQATIVFNGDFHWFDRDPSIFSDIDRRVLRHYALRGNVETELGRDRDIDVGCGCAYPQHVEQSTVDWSNAILRELRETALCCASQNTLAQLPMTMVASVGKLRVGIVHGDGDSLAGWGFSDDLLDNPHQQRWLDRIRLQSGVDIFASSHTCLPVLRSLELKSGRLIVANNGSAGMPNFENTGFGVLTRIAIQPRPEPVLHRVRLDSVYIEAVAVDFDAIGWQSEFLLQWPPGTSAWQSYWKRIAHGPSYSPAMAYSYQSND